MMENTQSEHHKSETSVPAPNVEIKSSRSKQADTKKLLVYLLMHHPWLFVTGLFAVFLGSGALSIYSLGHVGHVEPEEAADPLQAEVIQPETISRATTADNISPIPLSMVGAIALSCASGSYVLWRFLNRRDPHLKVKKTVSSHRKVTRQQIHLAQREYQRSEPRLTRKVPVFVHPSRTTMRMESQTKPVVTILPPEQNFNHIGNKQSLANLLDIRQQTSLSSILRK